MKQVVKLFIDMSLVYFLAWLFQSMHSPRPGVGASSKAILSQTQALDKNSS